MLEAGKGCSKGAAQCVVGEEAEAGALRQHFRSSVGRAEPHLQEVAPGGRVGGPAPGERRLQAILKCSTFAGLPPPAQEQTWFRESHAG